MILPGDTVTFDYTGRLEDGTVFDTSRQSVAESTGMADRQAERSFEPRTVTMAGGDLIMGLEHALIGREAGEEFTAEVPPDIGYGEYDPENIREFDPDVFDDMMRGDVPTVGTVVETEDGDIGTITDVTDERVEVDFNHELAGETLIFDIDIIAVE